MGSKDKTLFRLSIFFSCLEEDPHKLSCNRINKWIVDGKIKAYVYKVFLMEEAYKAHVTLGSHYMDKLCFKIGGC